MAVNAQDARHQPSDSMAGIGSANRRDFRSTFLISCLRMTGKAMGIVKTLVIAAWFGASGSLDAFWVAYMLPQMMPGLILGVVTLAFIPSFMRSAGNGNDGIDWRGLNTLFTVVGLTVMTLAVLIAVGRNGVVSVMAPGLPDDVHQLAADLTGLMSIAVLIFGVNAMLSAVMQAVHRFGIMSLESVVTNTVIIAGAILLSGPLGVTGLVYAVIAGFGVHMLLLLWANRDLVRYKLRPAFDFAHADFRGSAGHMLPLLIGYVGSISIAIIDRIFVSTLDSGGISIFVYASMIAMLPMEVFGQAVITAFYPGLSRDQADGDTIAVRETQVRGMRLLLFVMLPAAVGLIMAADAIVSLLLERGAFTAQAGSLTAATLAALAIGLPLRAINYFNFRVFHARREPWLAIGVGLFGVVINVAFDFLLIGPLGLVGIALATSIAMAASVVLSTILLQRRQHASFVRPMLKPLGKLVVMTLGYAVVVALLFEAMASLAILIPEWLFMVLHLAAFVPAGLVFLYIGHLLRFEEVHTLLAFARRRLSGKGSR